jgi:hypothetical protein
MMRTNTMPASREGQTMTRVLPVWSPTAEEVAAIVDELRRLIVATARRQTAELRRLRGD